MASATVLAPMADAAMILAEHEVRTSGGRQQNPFEEIARVTSPHTLGGRAWLRAWPRRRWGVECYEDSFVPGGVVHLARGGSSVGVQEAGGISRERDSLGSGSPSGGP